MNLIQACVANPVKVAVGVLLLSLFGILALLAMPTQLTPEVQIPTITVETRWRGASPMEVEREIVQPLEEQLRSVEGLVKLSSESGDSGGAITLEFPIGTDMSQALVKVNTRVQQVRDEPFGLVRQQVGRAHLRTAFGGGGEAQVDAVAPQRGGQARPQRAIVGRARLRIEYARRERDQRRAGEFLALFGQERVALGFPVTHRRDQLVIVVRLREEPVGIVPRLARTL